MSPRPIIRNTLFYGDNLIILREHISSESVDLVYLDPPFNSSRNYNVLFKDEHGTDSEAQITAFADTWHWNDIAEQTYNELLTQAPDTVSRLIAALRDFVGTNQMMAYLVMMTIRLVELHRVLKPTGSLYLHCDPTASHYLKIILDTIFQPQNFRNEISWHRTGAHSDGAQGRKGLGRVRDIILFYSKSENFIWNPQHIPYDDAYIKKYYKSVEPETGRRYWLDNLTGPGGAGKGNPAYEVMGVTRYWRYSQEKMQKLIEEGRIVQTAPGIVPRYKRYLDEMPGLPLQDDWDDISPINSQAKERLGYPTQKPLALLERIVAMASNPGAVILDPFCGCGTAIAAAQKVGRTWIGIDITHLSIALQKYRLEAMFPGILFDVVGEPQDVGAARHLAQSDRYQFQWWALSLVRARPIGGEEGSREGKKGSDKGIDGVIAFIDDTAGKAKRVLIQVKSGHVNSSHIRDLVGTMQREQAALGVYITLEEPTRDMTIEALKAGFYHSPGWNRDFPRIQILTIEALLHNAEVKMPPQFGTFKQAQRVQQADTEQFRLELG
ncbi:MAG: restriction endonuclease [Chloroflexota bacterium]|nr:restriction endonuclease [Chloroflexota bacterium]